MPLRGKRVLITGAGSGIGRALAVEAARRGMRVALCGRRRAALAGTAEMLGSAGEHPVIVADLMNPQDRHDLVNDIALGWGAIDILVNNAGVVEGGPIERVDDDMLDRIFRTNVIAPMALARDLMPLLLSARPSRVVNVGSVFGDIAYPDFAAYSASKFALRGFSTALRREWAGLGIGVTYVAPRATRTDAAAAFGELIAGAKMNLDLPENVARQIWDAVARGKDSFYIAGPERFYVLLQRLAPALIDRAIARPPRANAA
jgi:short-subunit dehydrogenase